MNQTKPLIALLTDFGSQDIYVGVMKGVIKGINPEIEILDLSHEIPPQNILAASYCLKAAVPYCPKETIYLAVVDPGVGTNRRALGIQFERGYLIGPDNGLFSGVLGLYPPEKIRELTDQRYWRTEKPSQTFHGRDIFAPVAAHLSRGTPLEKLGTPLDPTSLTLYNSTWQSKEDEIIGNIQYIDHFGNLITNIPETALSGEEWIVSVKGYEIIGGKTYAEVEPGQLIALISSEGWLEIAVNGGSAKKILKADYGEEVRIFNLLKKKLSMAN